MASAPRVNTSRLKRSSGRRAAVVLLQPPCHVGADQLRHRGASALGDGFEHPSVAVIEPDILIMPTFFGEKVLPSPVSFVFAHDFPSRVTLSAALPSIATTALPSPSEIRQLVELRAVGVSVVWLVSGACRVPSLPATKPTARRSRSLTAAPPQRRRYAVQSGHGIRAVGPESGGLR